MSRYTAPGLSRGTIIRVNAVEQAEHAGQEWRSFGNKWYV